MSNQIEEKVNSAFSKATPDISQSVVDDCKGITVYRTAPTKRPSANFWKVAALAMALVLVITGVVGGVELGATAQAAVVVLDVNPSIQLKIDGKNRIKEAVANNDDAQIILQGMDLKGSALDTAIYAIIGSMTVHGYLNEYTNSVLVSVDTKKQATYDNIVDIVTNKIQVTLNEHNIDSSVVSQWIKNNDVASQIAHKYNVSMGKAQLIAKILEASAKDTSQNATVYTVEDLVKHNVNELAILMSKYTGKDTSDVKTEGTASEKAYVGKQKAKQIALADVGLDKHLTEQGIDLYCDVELDIEDGTMVYEVEFVYSNYIYEVDVKALDGEVIKSETKHISIFHEDKNLPNLTDDELVSKATEGLQDVSNLQVNTKGKQVQISFQAGNYQYQVDLTQKGTLLSLEKHLTTTTSDDRLSADKIKQIALEMLSHQLSFLDSQIDEIDCQLSDDGSYYEVEIELFGLEFEFRIDAKTGQPMRFGGFGHNHNK